MTFGYIVISVFHKHMYLVGSALFPVADAHGCMTDVMRGEARPRADVAVRIVHFGYPSRLDCFGAVRLAMTDGEGARQPLKTAKDHFVP